MYYVLATVEGLHLTCDFVIYSAALYGCQPSYTPVLAHEAFRQPYEVLGGLPFGEYDRMALVSRLDEETLEAMSELRKDRSLRCSTCMAFEMDLGGASLEGRATAVAGGSLLREVLERGERIVDTIRLFLFKPGQDRSIGRVGGVGNGVCGAWVGDEENAVFFARKLHKFQFVQSPLDVSLSDVRTIYDDPVFRELHSAGCGDPRKDDPLLRRVFQALKSFRLSRDLPDAKAQFLELARIAEHLSKRGETEKTVRGSGLRARISTIAARGWLARRDFSGTVIDLWDNVRNPLTHSAEDFCELGRDGAKDVLALEEIVIAMTQATVIAWRNEQFGVDPYDYLLGSK